MMRVWPDGSLVRMSGFDREEPAWEVHAKAPVVLLTNFDLLAGIATAVRQRRKWEGNSRNRRDNVIVADGALVAQAEDVIQIQAPVELAIGQTGWAGGFSKLPVVVH